MQASMASWQLENCSADELSPPISPVAPSSPSLYNYGGVSPNPNNPIGKNAKNSGGVELLAQSRAQMATNLLRDLEEFESIRYEPQNDLGLNWNEESVNLELFSALSDLDYAPPATPASEEFRNQQILSPYNNANLVASIPSSPVEQNAYLPEVYDKLSAEFQAILESLPQSNAGNTSIDEFDDLIAISGIPAPHYPQESQTQSIMNNNTLQINEPIVSIPMDFGNNYSGLLNLNENSNSNSNVGSYYSASESDAGECSNMNISEETLEENANAAENILDALLLGNLTEAQSYLPTMENLPVGNTITFFPAVTEDLAMVVPMPSTSVLTTQQSKPKSEAKRGKSSGGRRRGVNGIADKSLRKKEQNKTAATRYRLKKKLESVVVSEVEQTMQKENEGLQAQTNDLGRQISIVKQLLRDIMDAKKLTQNRRLH